MANGDILLDPSGNLLGSDASRYPGSSGDQMLSNGSAPACCYLQSYLCSNNAPSGLWLGASSIPSTNAIIQAGVCYYFEPADIALPCPGGPLHSGYSTITGCSDSSCGGAGTPCNECSLTPGQTASWMASYTPPGSSPATASGILTCSTGGYGGHNFGGPEVLDSNGTLVANSLQISCAPSGSAWVLDDFFSWEITPYGVDGDAIITATETSISCAGGTLSGTVTLTGTLEFITGASAPITIVITF